MLSTDLFLRKTTIEMMIIINSRTATAIPTPIPILPEKITNTKDTILFQAQQVI